MGSTRGDSTGTYSPRRLRDFARPAEKEQPYLRRPRPEPRPRLPIVHWIVLLLICLAIYNFGFSKQGIRTLLQLRRDTETYVEREESLRREHAQLVRDRDALERGEAVERFARERHHFLGDNEEIYIIPRTTPDHTVEAGGGPPDSADESWPQ